MYPVFDGRCKQRFRRSRSDIGWSLHIDGRNSKNYFLCEINHTFFKVESGSIVSCGLCTEDNIGQELKNRNTLGYTDDFHEIVLGYDGDFKVQCKKHGHKFVDDGMILGDLELQCSEDTMKNTITIDIQFAKMPECKGKNLKATLFTFDTNDIRYWSK